MVPDVENAWRKITRDEIEALRRLMKALEANSDRQAICEDAAVHPHDLKNFISGNSKRPKARMGVRLMAYAARYEETALSTGTPDLSYSTEQKIADYKVVKQAARGIFEFDADDDFFFRHIDKLKVMDAQECEQIVKNKQQKKIKNI